MDPPKPTPSSETPGGIPSTMGCNVAKSVDVVGVGGGVVDLNRARYFRVYDARGKLLLDVLPERLAKRFQREWNRTRRGPNRCRLIRCLVVETER